MIEMILGFAIGYGVPMFLLKRYIAHRRRDVAPEAAAEAKSAIRNSKAAA